MLVNVYRFWYDTRDGMGNGNGCGCGCGFTRAFWQWQWQRLRHRFLLAFNQTARAPSKQLLGCCITVLFGVIERTKPVKVNHGRSLGAELEAMERGW